MADGLTTAVAMPYPVSVGTRGREAMDKQQQLVDTGKWELVEPVSMSRVAAATTR